MADLPATGAPARAELVARLMDAMAYPRSDAEEISDRLLALRGELRSVFLAWWRSGSVPELERAGFRATELRERFGMNPVAVLLTLEDLERDPVQVGDLLRRGFRLAVPPAVRTEGPPL